ncbi:hypothetical protein CTEN210_06595 [Chaetoceros tenuissimus]|uniref:Cytosine-specific methyltransferase n=1 Tax=Chaetoceros tenuissimus TaxID=426638 RepID=A0AAD3H4Y8_9STRA|nr:hypothetical protein CTEN210_06595 [Chaetoceros tenuissimus]
MKEFDFEKLEPVLLVPPKLTKSSYATLIQYDLVARKWHLEGRYGSRTHKVDLEEGYKMGIPLAVSSESSATRKEMMVALIEFIQKIHDFNSERDAMKKELEFILQDCKEKNVGPLLSLLMEEGVDIIVKEPVVSNRIPKEEPFDATHNIHMKPDNYDSLWKELIASLESENRCKKSNRKRQKVSDAKFTFCELFAGIGGFGVALEALGGKCVFASEIYEPSRRLYVENLDTSGMESTKSSKNSSTSRIAGDIWDVDSKDIPSFDILTGGFPCQPFSTLGDQPGLTDSKHVSGRRKGLQTDNDNEGEAITEPSSGDGRGQLFTQIVRILRDKQPGAFLLENVPGILTTDGGNAIQKIVQSLEDVGYNVDHQVISSRGLTAQSRKRLYIVGIAKRIKCKPFQFPFIPDLKLRARHVLHSESELQGKVIHESIGIPIELLQECGFKDCDLLDLFALSNQQMTQLTTRSKKWRPSKLAWDNTSCDTIDSHYGISVGKGNSQLVPNATPLNPRRFTPRECARVMGFSNTFTLGKFICKKKESTDESFDDEAISTFNSYIKENYYMLGNAVCPPVIATIAGSILACAFEEKDETSKGENFDWSNFGLLKGIELSFSSVSAKGKSYLLECLRKNKH